MTNLQDINPFGFYADSKIDLVEHDYWINLPYNPDYLRIWDIVIGGNRTG